MQKYTGDHSYFTCRDHEFKAKIFIEGDFGFSCAYNIPLILYDSILETYVTNRIHKYLWSMAIGCLYFLKRENLLTRKRASEKGILISRNISA